MFTVQEILSLIMMLDAMLCVGGLVLFVFGVIIVKHYRVNELGTPPPRRVGPTHEQHVKLTYDGGKDVKKERGYWKWPN